MNNFRSWFLKSVPEEYFNEFRMEILKENISRIQIYSLVFIFIELSFVFIGIFQYSKGLWAIETVHKQMFYLHLVVTILILLFIFLLFTRKKKDNPSPFYILFEIFFISFVLLWTIVSSITQLPLSFTVIPYIIGCLGIAVAVYINTVFSFILYTCSFIILLLGLYFNCSDLEVFRELITDSSIVILISFVVSRIIFQNKIDSFLYQKKIEKEINEKDLAEQSLQKMNSNLENLIKERTQTLININEQLSKEFLDKQNLEQKLINEKNTLNNIIYCNPYSIAVFDKNGFFLRGNPAGLKLFTIAPPPEYCIFKDPQLSTVFHSEFEKLKNGETVIFPELNYNPRNSNPKYPDQEYTLKTTMFPIKNTQGEIENFIQMHADVTERYKAEAELRLSEEKYRLIVENMEEGIYATQNGIFNSVNNAMTKMFGYSADELIGMPAWNLASQGIKEEVKAELFKKTKSKDTTPISIECLKKNGDVFFADIRISGATGKGLAYGIVSDISERKHAEEVLKESEEKYKLLVDNITEVIFLLDIKGNISYISDFFENITDYKVEDVIRRPLVDFVYIDDLPGLLASYSKTLSGADDISEFRIVLKNGTTKYVQTKNKLIVKEDGTKQLIGIMLDIEKQKDIEQNLIILESAVNQSTDGIAVADMGGILIYLNDAWAKMHGYTKAELIGQNLKICHNETQIINDVNPFNLQVIKNGYYQGEVGHIKREGTPFPTWMHTTLLKDKKGNPSGLIGIARDISEQKKAEKNLKISEEKYRQLFENAPSGILLVDLNGNVLDANKALLSMLGSPSIEYTKKLNALTLSNMIDAGISQKLQECIATESIIVSEHIYHSKMNKSVHARIRFKPILNNEHNVTGVQAIIDDITYQKEFELKQKEIMDLKFAEAENHKKIFMENLANAIRIPANMIHGFSNILMKPDLSEKKYKFIADSIINKSNILLRNVNNISTASQLELKTLQLNKTICSPEKIINEIISTYSEIAEIKSKKIEIRKASGNNKKLKIFTDEQRLKQVLSELLDNAINNTHYGVIELGFKLEDEDSIVFKVSDTGTGISPNKQKDFFANLHNPTDTTNPNKLALGLIICKGIVEQLGGKIYMESEEGRGTTFYFTIPVKV